MFSFETQHPSEGFDIVVTGDEDGRIERVTDEDKEEMSLSTKDLSVLAREASQEYAD